MRLIIKAAEPDSFRDWKRNYVRENGRAAKYRNLDEHRYNYIKRALKEKLISEQHGLCCYCCNGININNSHIEHFFPKSISFFP